MRRSKKISKLRVTGLCEDNSSVTGDFLAQMASNAENVLIWWRRHLYLHAVAKWIEVTEVRSKDQIAKLGEGQEYDEEHYCEGSQILGTAA